MTRKEAVSKLVDKQLRNLSNDEREEYLVTVETEPWSEDLKRANISPEIIKEFESGELNESYSSERYNSVLKFWLKHKLRPITNEYIGSCIGSKITSGNPIIFQACPCCGYRSIEEKSSFEICIICWWEDDGQDNDKAEEIYGGPNEVNLIQARYNFLKHETYNPDRKDLEEFHENKSKYLLGRIFKINEEGYLIEEGTAWKSNQYVKTKT